MTADRIPALLEPIQNRLNAATPGPWEVRVDGLTEDVDVLHDQEQVSFIATCGEKKFPRALDDAEFIAAAPTDQARLLAAVQAVAEVHRPERGTVHDPDDGETKEMDYCETCSDSPWLDESTAVAYPCPTVAAVVAALGGEA